MKRFMYCSICVMCLSIAAVLCTNLRSAPAFAHVGCRYEAVFFDTQSGPFVYALRGDGVVTRYGLTDGSVYTLPATAPPGSYVALLRYEPHPFFNGLFALRDDGEMFFMPWGVANATWQPFATLAPCQPVSSTPSTLGGVKAKYR